MGEDRRSSTRDYVGMQNHHPAIAEPVTEEVGCVTFVGHPSSICGKDALRPCSK